MFRRAAPLIGLLAVTACQSYEFAFQPDSDRQGRHLRFDVKTPSKADLLFVVDNSRSMLEEQQVLIRSFDALITALGETDTSYRVGLISSDGVGVDQDCQGNPINTPEHPSDSNPEEHDDGARGNCDRPEVILRRPHDGVRGRLMSAFDPNVFVLTNPLFNDLTATQKVALQRLFPTAIDTGPLNGAVPFYANGDEGVPWVIDRDMIRVDACNACDCSVCDKDDTCYQACAEPVGGALVRAFFASNVAGLGSGGTGWEEGIRVGLRAVGIDMRLPEAQAGTPARDLTAISWPNSYAGLSATGARLPQSWTRSDAVLGIMFVTDEDDCSMPEALWRVKDQFEEVAGKPAGSICYQEDGRANLLSTTTMAGVLTAKKGSIGRVVIGTIGSVTVPVVNGLDGSIEDPPGRNATASDCMTTFAITPDTNCSCLYAEDEGEYDQRWCEFTQNQDEGPASTRCNALASSRYVEFADRFTRRVYDSVCRADTPAYGPALEEFARLAREPCFDLSDTLKPVNANPTYIKVKRSPQGVSGAPTELPQVAPEGPGPGWFYNDDENRICLVGLERLIGDTYDIYVGNVDSVDYTR